MTDKFNLLIREVERLVTAPYAPSLQDLHNIVKDIPSSLLHSWAFCKPCQVGLLADVLVEGLSRSVLALQLLSTFSTISTFRNSLLERYPSLLDRCLQKAIEDEDSEYLPACAGLLFSPLPSELVIPARLSTFIMKLVDNMGQNPCAETIIPLYQLMTSLQGSPGTLSSLTPETMSTLQLEFTKTLRNLDDHMGNLLCLATFARITTSQKMHFDVEHGPPIPSWLQHIQHFFGAKRGLKTLELVFLRVILACSTSYNNLTISKAAESIRLAINICDAVEPEQKKAWIAGNSHKITKLCEKVSRDGISSEIQMMGVAFLVLLLPPTALPHEICSLCQQMLVSKNSRKVVETIPFEFIPRLAGSMIISSGESAVYSFVEYSFSALRNGCTTDYDVLNTIRIAESFVHTLQNLDSQTLAPSAVRLISSLGKATMRELLQSFPRRACRSQCDGSGVCFAALSTSQNQLLIDLFNLYYSMCTRCRSIDSGDSDSPDLKLLAAFMTQVKGTLSSNDCSFSTMKGTDHRDLFSLPNVKGSLPKSRSSRDWRNGIAETLMLNAQASHQNILSKVEEICQDLEHRCFNTEAPLREVEEQREKLLLETEDLKRHNKELETQLQQASTTISSLQQEMASLGQQAESATAHAEELSGKLDAARRELEDQRRDSQESAHTEREKARSRELDLIATMTEKDDQLEELQEQLRDQRAENDEIRRALDAASTENAAALEASVALRQEVTRLKQSLEESNLHMMQKDEDVKQLLAEKESMSSEIVTLQKKLDDDSSESDRLRSALRTAEEKFTTDFETIQQERKREISEATAEIAKHKDEILTLRDAMQAAASRASQELQTKEKRIQHLEKKVQLMRNERSVKAREFSEAQQHISRLMSVMGFKPNPEEPKASTKHHRSKPNLGPSNTAATQQENESFMDGETQSQLHNTIAESSEYGDRPSPKRSRNDLGSPGTPSGSSRNARNQPRQSLRPRTSTQHRRERRPLSDADGNSPAKSQATNASKNSQLEPYPESQVCDDLSENRLQHLDLDMELESSRDSFFASTPFNGGGGDLFTQRTPR